MLRFVVLSLIWLGLTTGMVLFSADYVQYSVGLQASHNIFFVFEGLITILFFIILFLGGKNKGELEASNKLSKEARATVNARFPKSVNFVPSNDVIHYVHKHFDEVPNSLNDNDSYGWESVLKDFPRQPRTQAESAAGEAMFWTMYANYLVDLTSEGLDLLHKQALIEFFSRNEKWIFRRYFAATGRVHETHGIKLSKIIDEMIKAKEMPLEYDFWNSNSDERDTSDERAKQRRNSAVDQAERKLENFRDDVLDPFIERWGNWFASHVEEAYQISKKASRQSDNNTHGDGGLATPRDIKNLSNRVPARSSAQTQRFND